jgi:hypothetical protein
MVEELGYWSYELDGAYHHYYPDIDYTNKIKKGLIRDCVLFRRYFFNNTPDKAFFLEAGVQGGLIVSDKSVQKQNFNNVITESPLASVDNNFQIGFAAGLGFKWNRVTLETRVKFGQNTVQDNTFLTTVPRISSRALFVKANYRLF